MMLRHLKILIQIIMEKINEKIDIFRLSIQLQIATYVDMSQRHLDPLCTKKCCI